MEILFRGKRIDTGEWVYGDFYRNCGVTGIIYDYMISTRDGMEYPVIPETIGQYTGIDDKDGVKIFEWDVLHDSGYMLNGVVKYYAKCGGWWYWGKKRFGSSLEFDGFDELTVIGNIHDNPELLDG